MTGEKRIQTAGELLTGPREALADLQEETAALVLLIFQIQSQSQPVLQLGTKFLHMMIFHALKPGPKVVHKTPDLILGRVQGAQQKGQPLPEQVAGAVHPLQNNAQPDRKTGFCLAQPYGQRLILRGTLSGNHSPGRGGRRPRRGSFRSRLDRTTGRALLFRESGPGFGLLCRRGFGQRRGVILPRSAKYFFNG